MADDNAQPQGPAQPDPALKQLEFFVGAWSMRGRTVDSDEDNVSGQTSFEWLPGDGNDVTIRTEFGGGATWHGTVSDDGTSYSGGWRPDEGKEGPGNVSYDLWGTRTK